MVDRIACDGFGMCAELLPELIELDDWGYPIVRRRRRPGRAPRPRPARRRVCPVLALGSPDADAPVERGQAGWHGTPPDRATLRPCASSSPRTIRGLRDVIVLGLADSGYHVDAVERGDDAIDQLRFYEYDVAILDWRMPGREGIDVVEWARRHDRPTAILMLTARDTPADRIRGLDSGADDYLVKPFDFGELLARVRALQRRPRGVDGADDRARPARPRPGHAGW